MGRFFSLVFENISTFQKSRFFSGKMVSHFTEINLMIAQTAFCLVCLTVPTEFLFEMAFYLVRWFLTSQRLKACLHNLPCLFQSVFSTSS